MAHPSLSEAETRFEAYNIAKRQIFSCPPLYFIFKADGCVFEM